MSVLARFEAISGEAPLGLVPVNDTHRGDTILVCGCGESLNELGGATQLITIGVNDIGRRFHPDCLVVVNPRSQFAADRVQYVEQSRYLFTHLDLGPVRAPVVRFTLGKFWGTDLAGDVLHYTQNSPYVAVGLAAYMGARRIGLIGVEFTDHHFLCEDGPPSAGRAARAVRQGVRRAGRGLASGGVEPENPSPISRLQGPPRVRLEDFTTDRQRPARAVGTMPAIAGTSAATARLFVVNYRFLSCGDVFADGLRHDRGRSASITSRPTGTIRGCPRRSPPSAPTSC